MTLVNRVSAYFLAALAVVLAVCSALSYGIIRRQMTQQYQQELYGALHSLVASIEVEPEDVNWQPLEHTIGLGVGEGSAEIRWLVIGDRVQIVEASRNASEKFVAVANSLAADATEHITEQSSPALHGWRFLRQRLVAPAPKDNGRELDEFDEIVVVVGRSTSQLNAGLTRLAAFAILLPLSGWLAAAVVGRRFCRRALQPVATMAREARSMSGADFKRRLPVSSSGDELTELGIAFNTMLNRLEHSFEAQRRFTGDAAHELRTPLTVLIGQIDVALRKSRTAEEYRGTLKLLHDESLELREILESLLFLARSDDEAPPPDVAPTPLAEWLPQYLERWDDHPRRADIRLEIDGAADVVASRPLLNRLLDNLMGNALKYSEAGAPVIVKLSRVDGEAVVSVTDQGAGISPEDVPSVFEPFFRARAARSSGVAGVGLGLAIADRIARTLHGRLTCESELGRGSSFAASLPCC
jgi:heavy metal sensor kinase